MRGALTALVADVVGGLSAVNAAREEALPACRSTIRASGSCIRSIHRLQWAAARGLLADAEESLRRAQGALAPYPELVWAGFLHDAGKEFAEAALTLAIVEGSELPGPKALDVDGRAWMKGLVEAASELRRHLLDRLREGDLARGEQLLAAMDDVYDALIVVDFPDAVTSGLRRSLDALRAVLERSRGDVTATVVQERLRRAVEAERSV